MPELDSVFAEFGGDDLVHGPRVRGGEGVGVEGLRDLRRGISDLYFKEPLSSLNNVPVHTSAPGWQPCPTARHRLPDRASTSAPISRQGAPRGCPKYSPGSNSPSPACPKKRDRID